MTTAVAIQMTPQGLLIPRAALQDWGEVEAIQSKWRIVLRPKKLTPTQARELATQALREDGLLVEMPRAPLDPPVTPAERAELAHKLSVGQPLSEMVIEERRAGW